MRALLDAAPPARGGAGVVAASSAPAVHAGVRARARGGGGARLSTPSAGVPVLVRRKPGALCTPGVFALGGARDEPPERAGLTSHARRARRSRAPRAAPRRRSPRTGELLGGSVGGAAGSESFGWSISVPRRHAAPRRSSCWRTWRSSPTIPDDALETERTIALADLAALRDDMYRYPVRLATAAAFAGHPYGVPASGDEVTLPRITADEVRDVAPGARAGRAAVVVARRRRRRPDELAGLAARRLRRRCAGASAASLRRRPCGRPRSCSAVEQREKAQTALALLFPGPARTDDARFAAAMIAGVASGLGGRFFDELRDKQSLGYTVHAFASERALAGAFVAYIATAPEKEEVARRGLLAEFAKLREAPVTAKELEQAQTYAIGMHAIRQQSGGAVLGDMVDAWLFGRLAELDAYEARVRGVTAPAMQALARRYFDESRRVEGIIRGVGKTV